MENSPFFTGPNAGWMQKILDTLCDILVEIHNENDWQGCAIARATPSGIVAITVGILGEDAKGLQAPRVIGKACEKASRALLTGKRTMLSRKLKFQQYGGGVPVNGSGYGISGFQEPLDEAGAQVFGYIDWLSEQRPDADPSEIFNTAENALIKIASGYEDQANPNILKVFYLLKSKMKLS